MQAKDCDTVIVPAIISCSQRLRPIPCFPSSPLFPPHPLKVPQQVLHRHEGPPWMYSNPPALLSPHLSYLFQSPRCSCPMLCLEVFDGPSISSWRLFGLCSFVCYFLNVCVCGFLFHNSVLIMLFCPERDLDWITLMKQRLPPFTHPYRWF